MLPVVEHHIMSKKQRRECSLCQIRLQLKQTRNMPTEIAVPQLTGGNFLNFCSDHILP